MSRGTVSKNLAVEELLTNLEWVGRGAPSNGEIKIRCPEPEHEDRNPSASLKVVDGKWYCHSCHAGGGAQTLVWKVIPKWAAEKLSKISSLDAARIAEWRQGTVAVEQLEAHCHWGQGTLWLEVAPNCWKYLRKTGKGQKLTWSHAKDPAVDLSRVLWSPNVVAGEPLRGQTALILEGEWDAMVADRLLKAAGNPQEIGIYSLTGGAGQDAAKWGQALRVGGCRRVILGYDEDEAGRTGLAKAKVACGALGLSVSVLRLPSPEGQSPKDLSDWLGLRRLPLEDSAALFGSALQASLEEALEATGGSEPAQPASSPEEPLALLQALWDSHGMRMVADRLPQWVVGGPMDGWRLFWANGRRVVGPQSKLTTAKEADKLFDVIRGCRLPRKRDNLVEALIDCPSGPDLRWAETEEFEVEVEELVSKVEDRLAAHAENRGERNPDVLRMEWRHVMRRRKQHDGGEVKREAAERLRQKYLKDGGKELPADWDK